MSWARNFFCQEAWEAMRDWGRAAVKRKALFALVSHGFRFDALPPFTVISNVLLDQHCSLECASCMHRLPETGLLIQILAFVVRL